MKTKKIHKKTVISAGQRVLGVLNRKVLNKAHNSLSQGREEKYRELLNNRVEKLKNGKKAFVDKLLMKETVVFLNKMIRYTKFGKIVEKKLINRSEKIFEEISPFIEGENILDLGCGDGKVGELIAQKLEKKVKLCDIVDYNKTDLEFINYNGESIPLEDKSVDTVLLSVVLHHSDNPMKMLDEAFRVSSKRIIIIESIFFNEMHKSANAFLDLVYNRILNNPEINVPFNFLRPAGWVQELEARGGRIIHMEHLGLDVPIVPEWHVLYVVDVSNSEKLAYRNIDELEWKERFTYLKNVPFDEKDLGCKGSKFQIVKFTPGTGIGAHYHENTSEIFYIRKGNGILKINGKKRRCKPDDFILCKPGEVHEFINDTKEEFVILIFKINEKKGDIKFC